MRLPFSLRTKITPSSATAIVVSLLPLIYFLPATRGKLVISPDDGVIFNVPLRVAAANMMKAGYLPLWNPYIFSGMPLHGSAQAGILFPLNWFYLISNPPAATNLMMLSTYALAALGAYLYARRSGATVAGAALTSLVWQWSGFLIAQIGHTNVVQTAALLPWMLWALDGYAASGERKRGVLLAAIVALQVFAGHQQTLCYALLIASAYAVVMWRASQPTRNWYLRSLLLLVAGVVLAAVQILPTYELMRNSLRTGTSFDFFTSFSLHPRFLLTFLAPYVLGGGDGSLFRAPYVGQPFYGEYIGYVGVGAIMLALLALFLKRDARNKFWATVVVIGLALALGRYWPFKLYGVIYYLPILNLFRVPARHLMEVDFALAVLAGRGLTAIQAATDLRRARRWVLAVGAAVLFLTVLTVTVGRPAEFRLGRVAPVSLLRAPELFLPLVFAALSVWAVWTLVRSRRPMAVLLTIAVISLDLIVWGQSSGWRRSGLRAEDEYWNTPETVKLLRELQQRDLTSSRILTAPHPFDPAVPPVGPAVSGLADSTLWTQPDVYMMHGIENAAGYDGFGLARYSRLAGDMKIWGELDDPDRMLRSDSREIDILNVRYLVSSKRKDAASAPVPPTAPPANALSSQSSAYPTATKELGNVMFADSDLRLPSLGAGKRLQFNLPPVMADRVALLTNMSWSENVPDGTVIGRVRLTASDGRFFDFPLRAGADTAEWAYDRVDIRRRIRHRRAKVATSYPVEDAQGKYEAHTYLASFTFPEKATITGGEITIDRSELWPDLLLSIFRVSLIDSSASKAFPLRREWMSEGSVLESNLLKESRPKELGKTGRRWRLAKQTSQVDIYENERSLPRAWLVTDAFASSDDATLNVVRTGRLPDGQVWEPLRTALMETSLTLTPASGKDSRAEVTKHEPNRIEIKTSSTSPAILVLSENHYPGWRSYVDGQAAETLRVNYNQRGVLLPAGEHRVEMVYRPKSVLLGLIISLLTFLVLVLWWAHLLPKVRLKDR
jgi:membrane protein YfhO